MNPADTGDMSLTPHLDTIVGRTLENITRPYPTGMVLRVDGPGEWREHTDRFPIFYGSYDWHSSVHSHWQLVRILRCFPGIMDEPRITTTLDRHFTEDRVAGEMESVHLWPGFEMPYGMAWLLQLGAELIEWDDPKARDWSSTLQPLIAHAASEFDRYLSSRTLPVRSGTHNQTAFSLGLVYDWAVTAGNHDLASRVSKAAEQFYLADTDAPLEYEPSAVDFLSPALAEADLMRRVLGPDRFSHWLEGFLPPYRALLVERMPPQPVVDPSNGQLAHIAGLNMSRAWMAEAIAANTDGRLRDELLELAKRHREEGFEVALHPDYMVSHWAPSFVVYLMTRRGIR